MGGLVCFDKIFQAYQGPTSFIAYERGWVIFEYSHVFRSGGSLMYIFRISFIDYSKRNFPMAPLIFYTIEKKLFKEITRLYAIYTIP
jgi:hypothetical protein